MLRNTFNNIKIRGIKCACPTHRFENTRFVEKFGEKYVKRNMRMTGVESFYVCDNRQTASDLSYIAAESLLNDLGWDRDEVGVLVFVTQFADYRAPSTAFVLQKRLGIGTSCMVFDINLGCSGYVAGLQTVAALLEGSNRTKGLLLCADTPSKNTDSSDKSTALLFGDAGSATAIEIEPGNLLDCAQMSKGDDYKALYTPKNGYRYFGNNPNWKKEIEADVDCVGLSTSYMDGDRIFQFTINEVIELFNGYFTETKTSANDYDFFVFHQAQKLILDTISSLCDFPQDKVLSSLKEFGNTSVASIPLTLCFHRDKLQIKGSPINCFMSGFGIGLSYGIAVASLEADIIGTIIYSDDYFEG